MTQAELMDAMREVARAVVRAVPVAELARRGEPTFHMKDGGRVVELWQGETAYRMDGDTLIARRRTDNAERRLSPAALN